MKNRDLTKLQIRAEITLMLQKLNSLDEMSREQQLKYISKLNSIDNRDYVVEILVKELRKVNYQKGQIISSFLQEFATLEQVQDILWSYIKSPEASDELKDLAGITLKNLGDNTDPEEFLNYLEDPKSIVDKETRKLLEIASMNPEAQIDFLDFLFSLPESEQFNLVKSLHEDYSGEYIINVIAPTLESRQACHMDEYLIEILGESRSIKAVPILQDIITFYNDEKLKKKAKISLNMLKLAGIDIETSQVFDKNHDIAKVSDVYECHLTIPDGMGNQAVIASRIKPNGDILMMNIIINDVHGILDCFGFYGISKDDFKRIIERFQEKTTRFLVVPEYARYVLEEAEKINKVNNLPIPYEYVAWKIIIKDIQPINYDREEMTREWADRLFLKESKALHKFPDFDAWFFEDDDHGSIKNNIEKIVNKLTEKKDFYIENPHQLTEQIEHEINELIPSVFDSCVRKMYKKRLQNTAILFNITELPHFRNIVASLAWAIAPESAFDIINNSFVRKIVKKTILEGLIRHEHNLYNQEQQKLNPWNQRKAGKEVSVDSGDSKKQSIAELIEILCTHDTNNTENSRA